MNDLNKYRPKPQPQSNNLSKISEKSNTSNPHRDPQSIGQMAMQKSSEFGYSQLQSDLEVLERNFEHFKTSQLNEELVMAKQQKSINERFEKMILKKTQGGPMVESDIDGKIIEEGKDLRLYNFTRKTKILKEKVRELGLIVRGKNVEVGNLMVELREAKNGLLEKEAQCEHYKKLWEMRDRDCKAFEDGGFVDAREADVRNRGANKQNIVEHQRRYDEVNRMDDYNFWKTNNEREVQKLGQREQELSQNRGSYGGNQGNTFLVKN
jgi:hypothetical protein